MQFYPGESLNGDPSNYWAPNAACVRGLLDAAGFETTAEDVAGPRGIFHARRVVDPTAIYYRRLEKTTVEQAEGSDAGARAYIRSLESEVERKETQLAAALADKREAPAAVRSRGGGIVHRAVRVLRGR
jgi:hypothetical protein